MPTPQDRTLKDLYWEQFTDNQTSEEVPDLFDAFSFGWTQEDADTVAKLVLSGIKTATGSTLWAYEAEEKRPPQAGDLSIVLAANEVPVCIIRTTEAPIIPFNSVDESFAYAGGEGDRTLESWRRTYWKLIQLDGAECSREPSEQAPIVCERFEVIYQEPLRSRRDLTT